MIKTQNYRFLICLALFALAACSGAKKEEAADEGVATVLPDEKNEVTVLPLKRQISVSYTHLTLPTNSSGRRNGRFAF